MCCTPSHAKQGPGPGQVIMAGTGRFAVATMVTSFALFTVNRTN